MKTQTPDWRTWACQFFFGYPLGNRSHIKGKAHLPYGACGDFLDQLHEQAYSAAKRVQEKKLITNFSEAVSGVASRLIRAVDRLLLLHRGKKTICFLSGGWDSRAIVACMNRLLPSQSFKAYTTTYDNGNTLEEICATSVAKALGVEHQYIRLSCDYYHRRAESVARDCEYDIEAHVWMDEFLSQLCLPSNTVNFDGYAGDILLRCLLQQADDARRPASDSSFFERLAIIDPGLVLGAPVANTFKKLAEEELHSELIRWPREHRMLYFLLNNRGRRGVGHALRLQARSVSVAVPFLDPELFTYVLSIADSVRFRKDFYPSILTALDPRLKGVPSTNDDPLPAGWSVTPILKYQPPTVEWFYENISTAGIHSEASGGVIDWMSTSPLRHQWREERNEPYRRRRMRALEVLNLFALWHKQYASCLQMTSVLESTHCASLCRNWNFIPTKQEEDYNSIIKKYVEKARHVEDNILYYHFTMDVEAFHISDTHSYHTASCQLIDRLILGDFGSGSTIESLFHQNQVPCTYFLEAYSPVWDGNSRFAEVVRFLNRPWSDIGLHCHAFSLSQALQEELHLRPGWSFDSSMLTRVLLYGKQRIESAYKNNIAAYRSGRLDIYPEFEVSIAAAGLSIDSSYVAGREEYFFCRPPKVISNRIYVYNEGITEIPITAYRSYLRPKIFDFNLSSFEEICFVIVLALQLGMPAITMLMHSWSLNSIYEYPGLAKGFHYASSSILHNKLMYIFDFISRLDQVRFSTLRNTAALGKTILMNHSMSDANFPDTGLYMRAWRGDNSVHAQCILTEKDLFKQPEYAFYLLVNEQKITQRWYKKCDHASFSWPIGANAQDITVRGFVREAGDSTCERPLIAQVRLFE